MALIDTEQLRKRYIFHAEDKAAHEIDQIINELKKYDVPNTVSEATYTQEHTARKEAEFELFKLKKQISEMFEKLKSLKFAVALFNRKDNQQYIKAIDDITTFLHDFLDDKNEKGRH